MDWIFKVLLMPPSGPLLVGLVGVALLRRRRRAAIRLLVAGILLSYIFSIGFTANLLSRLAQCCPPLSAQTLATAHAGAIVVLAGGIYEEASEYGGATVHLRTLGRMRYAARLARQTGLPLLATGGGGSEAPADKKPAEAALMAQVLQDEFGLTDVLVESASRNTWENAAYSAALLRARGVDTIVLVTQAVHMRRAMESFQRAGLRVIPAPTLFFPVGLKANGLDFWLPSALSIEQIHYDLYELFGLLWYRWGQGGE